MPSESSSFSDLSFNNIEAIEGLDTLINLEDLSLSHNRISKIDSLDPLVNLQVLSLGNNQINNMMNVSTRPETHATNITGPRAVPKPRHAVHPSPRKIKHPSYSTRALNILKDHA